MYLGMSTIEYETHFALWCLVKAPLMLGTDLTKMSKDSESYKIISNQHLIAINQDPLRPVKEIHEDALNEVLRGITDENDRLEFCQQMPTHRQCESTEYRYRNTLIPPNPPTARDIETDGIFTKNAETGINNIVFDDQ